MNKTIRNTLLSVPLNKDRLYDDVIKQIAESDIPYISKASKDNLLLFKINDIDNLKKLWKDLLIDSICVLKINDSREKIYTDAKDYPAKFLSHFEDIRLTSSYGIDEISNYFDDFIAFESVLYGTDEHYRDHVDHVLQVWAIGVSLLSSNKFTLSEGYEINMNFNFHFEIPETKNKQNQISQSEIWAMWTINSLCHDLGYPIEKTAKINTQAKKIIGHFGNMNFSELSYSFDIFNTFLVDKFLNIISSKAIRKNSCKDKVNNELEKSKLESDDLETDRNEEDEVSRFTEIQTKYRDKLSKSLEEYKHGIFSSLLLFKNLTYFLETDYYLSGDSLSKEDLRQFFIRKEILRAIAAHTCPKIYHLSLNSLSFLLILCDELQEWNRPKFDELLKRKSGNEPSVEIKEFVMEPDQKIRIQFTYNFDIEDNNRKYFIDNRFRNIHCLLRSAKDDDDRKVIFIWDVIFKNKTYNLSFNSNKDSFEIMKFTEKPTSKIQVENNSTVLKLY